MHKGLLQIKCLLHTTDRCFGIFQSQGDCTWHTNPPPTPHADRDTDAAGRGAPARRPRGRHPRHAAGRDRERQAAARAPRSTSARWPPASMSRAPRCGKRCSSSPPAAWCASRRARACSSRGCRSTRCAPCWSTSASSKRCAPSSPRAASTTTLRSALDAAVAQCQEAAEHGGAAEYAVANTVFHEAIYAGCRNEYLAEQIRHARRLIQRYRVRDFQTKAQIASVARRTTARSRAPSRPATKRWPPRRCCCTCPPAPPASRSSWPRCR